MKKYDNENIDVMLIDIQNIPFADETFDVIIANSMLYHIPDLNKAISEVFRVLKKEGIFYASTYGEKGFAQYVNRTLKQMDLAISDTTNITFTLQNGKVILNKYFNDVKRYDYEDSFNITKVEDLVDYLYSMISMKNISLNYRSKLVEFYENEKNRQGIIEIKKEYGFFRAKNNFK